MFTEQMRQSGTGQDINQEVSKIIKDTRMKIVIAVLLLVVIVQLENIYQMLKGSR